MQLELATWPFLMSFVRKDITQNNAIIGMLSLNNAKYITIEYDYGSYIGGTPKRCGSNIDPVYRGVSLDIICF